MHNGTNIQANSKTTEGNNINRASVREFVVAITETF
tara:strand:+ start:95 stop:202 length:108 start_codon:yes stop_codon:yes gene_type:complete